MEWIFTRIREAFTENNLILDDYGQQLGLPAQGDSSGNTKGLTGVHMLKFRQLSITLVVYHCRRSHHQSTGFQIIRRE